MPEDKLDLVRKLLSKAEGTSNEHEAAAYLAKAQSLMTQYGIDEAMARQAGTDTLDFIERQMVDIPGRTTLIKAKRGLLATVATHNSCMVLIHTVRPGHKTESITGYGRDRERTMLMFNSLLIQMERAMRQDAGFRNDITYRNNFAWGYVARINQRLEQARHEAANLRGVGAELALRDTRAEVDRHIGKVRKAPAGKRRAYDPHARAAGDAAGNRAVLEDRLNAGATPKAALF